jgi:phage head maturation protease
LPRQQQWHRRRSRRQSSSCRRRHSAQLAPKSVDPKTRTVELTWTTGARVLK